MRNVQAVVFLLILCLFIDACNKDNDDSGTSLRIVKIDRPVRLPLPLGNCKNVPGYLELKYDARGRLTSIDQFQYSDPGVGSNQFVQWRISYSDQTQAATLSIIEPFNAFQRTFTIQPRQGDRQMVEYLGIDKTYSEYKFTADRRLEYKKVWGTASGPGSSDTTITVLEYDGANALKQVTTSKVFADPSKPSQKIDEYIVLGQDGRRNPWFYLESQYGFTLFQMNELVRYSPQNLTAFKWRQYNEGRLASTMDFSAELNAKYRDGGLLESAEEYIDIFDAACPAVDYANFSGPQLKFYYSR